MKRLLYVCAVIFGVSAQASERVCGWVSAAWNVPNGGAVFNRAPGPVANVMDALGEWRTHSMLSHGPGVAVTHSTAKKPDTQGWPAVCGTPLRPDQLASGYPGVATISQGAIYNFLYGDTDPTLRTSWLRYQLGNPTAAATIADSIWYAEYFADRSTVDSTVEIDRPALRGARVPYTFYQYRNIEGTHTGGASWQNGMACSTFLAYAHNLAGQGTVPAYTYSHRQLQAAANGIFTGVRDECRASTGFWGSLGLALVCPFYDVCSNAASQVTNCMGAARCDTSDENIWHSIRDEPASTATSISPDRLGGWGAHPVGTSVWSYDWDQPVTFNSPGSVYTCWY